MSALNKYTAIVFLLCCLSLNVKAQETSFLSHMAAGVKIGTNGVGVELAAPIGSAFQVSVGYSIIPPLAYKETINVPEHPGATVTGKGADVPTDVKATTNISNVELLLSYFPFSQNNFHVTAGLMYGPMRGVKVKNTTPLPSDYNIVGIDVEGYTVKAVDNTINGYIGVNSLRPYIGVGIGRAIDKEKRCCLAFDLGAVYWGKPGLYAPGEPLIGDWEDVQISSEDISGRDKGLIETAEKIILYPMLNASLYIKLF